jgi:2-amino-4-hydroxy-6-hydroxymethyldihydropteridine diphosphokinase
MRSRRLAGRLEREATIALGGNVGDVPRAFRQAISALDDSPATRVMAISALYRSQPLLPPGATHAAGSGPPAYYNAACRVRTRLGPRELLRAMQHIERVGGRIRQAHWAPRTLDLDLITYHHWQRARRHLVLPHPGLPFRSFVLLPLYDLGDRDPWQKNAPRLADVIGPYDGLDKLGIEHKQLSWIVA